jgi:signal transduction histidine kinase
VGSVKPVQKSVVGSLITDEARLSDKYFSEFADLVTPDEEDLKNALEAMGLKHLVVKKYTVENGDVPKSQEVIHAPGNAVFQNDNKEFIKTKSEFFAIASHDLRTPLNSVIGFSELLKQGAAGGLNEKQEHYVNNVLSSGKDLVCLISDILDLAGKIDLVIEKVSVQATINEIFNLIKENAAKNNIVLKKELDPALDFMEVDKQRFEQILFNLLINAIKFSKTNSATFLLPVEPYLFKCTTFGGGKPLK